MKFPSAFSILLLLLMFASEIDARRGPEEYWKAVMRDQPMPDAINGLLDQDLVDPSEEKKFWSHFKRDFDVSASAIIYHPHHHDHHDQKISHEEANILKA